VKERLNGMGEGFDRYSSQYSVYYVADS